jgi:hypothetical protein
MIEDNADSQENSIEETTEVVKEEEVEDEIFIIDHHLNIKIV